VHWPEVMLSFDETEGTLFSADAFGSYGAINGSIFADGKDFEKDLLGEARRYYTNIVGKYGMQTVAAINKASQLDIKMICPLHSYVWRKDIDKIINCYKTWGSYTPEVEGVFILTGSIYGHTANAAEVLMTELDKRGIDSVILDASATDISDIIAAAFTYSHIVIATPTYNNSVYSPVEHAVRELAAHGLTARSFSVIENGTWAPSAAKNILTLLEGLKNCKITGETVTIKSSGNDATRLGIEALAEAIENDIKNK
ncbi:MAG: FprA family A-type flavoprotein, partial [Clostridiales bacterium]|nr:FprA family A-type flavoprotein [Clostridiales bacterium]